MQTVNKENSYKYIIYITYKTIGNEIMLLTITLYVRARVFVGSFLLHRGTCGQTVDTIFRTIFKL